MIVDVHCHLALSARRVRPLTRRFEFEGAGARGMPGFDAYVPPDFMGRLPWRYLRWKLGLDMSAKVGEALDEEMESVWRHHLLGSRDLDRLVLLAFDEYHADDGTPLGPVESRGRGSSLYVSNSLVYEWCQTHPGKLLFGASVHPYRHDAIAALEEVHAAGAVLVKWLPVTQNIDPSDARTAAFVRRAGEFKIPLLIHYGGEVTLGRQHPGQEDPGPMLDLLTQVHAESRMPPVIVAHMATPAWPWQSGRYVDTLTRAMADRLRDAPLYADISALYYRRGWLKRFVRDDRYGHVRERLVFGSDFPIVPSTLGLGGDVRGRLADINAAASWPDRCLRIMRAVGFDESVFLRAAVVLGVSDDGQSARR